MSQNIPESAFFLNEEISKIQEYFNGKTIFLTGGTGFLGKLIVEKLLRTCPGVKRIYLLIREKKEVDLHERLKETFNVLAFETMKSKFPDLLDKLSICIGDCVLPNLGLSPENEGALKEEVNCILHCAATAFETLKSQFPDFLDKLSICIGDCTLPNLGLSPEDEGTLKEEVNCVLHCAATVRFDASLRKATYTNVRAIRDLLKMAKEMKHLTSFVFVSTAYSNCPRSDIDEVFYEPPIAGEKLIDLVDFQEDELLEVITPVLLGKWPNTYSFTKAVAEGIVKTQAENIPVAVVRPSIITAAAQEPLPGWVDNIYGITGGHLGSGLGLLRILRGDEKKLVDIVPVDYVVNTILAAAWNSSQNFNGSDDVDKTHLPPEEIPIYNYVNGPQNCLTWEKLMEHSQEHDANTPMSIAMWFTSLTMIKDKRSYLLLKFLYHTLPAYIVDFVLICFSKKPLLKEAHKKIDNFITVVNYFCMREWQFKNNNTQKLWSRLTPKDKELFNFDISKLVWYFYCKTYVEGFRVYLLKDPLDTVPKARRRALIFKVAHYTLLSLFWLCLCYLLMLLLTTLP